MDRNSGGELGSQARAGRDILSLCLSRFEPRAPIHLRCPDPPRLTVTDDIIKSILYRSCPASASETAILSFFSELNTHLFQTLFDASVSGERTLTSETLIELGLDPIGDRVFLEELADLYGIDVTLVLDNVCCPMTVI